jgi:hypothetical protein
MYLTNQQTVYVKTIEIVQTQFGTISMSYSNKYIGI